MVTTTGASLARCIEHCAHIEFVTFDHRAEYQKFVADCWAVLAALDDSPYDSRRCRVNAKAWARAHARSLNAEEGR